MLRPIPRRLFPGLFLALGAGALPAGCAWLGGGQPAAAPAPAARPAYDQVAAIRAAGTAAESVIAVQPLLDPSLVSVQATAERDARLGHYAEAAAALDGALARHPDSPDLLQDRAEIAVRLGDYAAAERLAHRSWALGPKLGPLCARNWQTVVEMRLNARDTGGAESARRWVGECRKPAVPRY